MGKKAPWAVAVLAVLPFLPALWGGFLNWDDPLLLLENLNYRGFSLENLRWMFSTNIAGHFMPLTWVSYAADYSLWGLRPAGYHLTNLLLHGVNAALVFFILRDFLQGEKRPARTWALVLATLVWAWHPFRVESVVWVTQRRDVLAALFIFLAWIFWERCRNGKVRRDYLFALLFFLLSLSAKASGIVLPAVITFAAVYRRENWRKLARPLAPFWISALAFAVLAALAQRDSNATEISWNAALWLGRGAQCLAVLPLYFLKIVWPWPLNPFIQFPPGFPWRSGLAWVGVSLTAACAAHLLRQKKVSPVFWALGAGALFLLPVSGLLQSGRQFMAERYTYLAAVPLSLLIAVGVQRWKEVRWLAAGALPVYFLSVLWYSHAWGDSVRLWSWALESNPRSAEVQGHLAGALYLSGETAQSRRRYDQALALAPRDAKLLVSYGDFLMARDAVAEAEAIFRRAVEADPHHGEGFERLGNCLLRQGRYAEADRFFAVARERKPNMWEIYCGWGVSLLHQEKLPESRAMLEKAREVNPGSVDVRNNLSIVYLRLNDPSRAVDEGRRAVSLAPGCAPCWANLANALRSLGDEAAGSAALENAFRLDPDLKKRFGRP